MEDENVIIEATTGSDENVKPVKDNESTGIPVETVEAMKAAYEAKIANERAEFQKKFNAQNELIKSFFSSEKPKPEEDLMASLVEKNNKKWLRRKF